MNTLESSDEDAATSPIAVVLMVGLVFATVVTVAVYVPQFLQEPPEPAPSARVTIESANFGDGVAKNDTVVVTHVGGDRLDRDRLTVLVGGETVYNGTEDSESSSATFDVPGLVVEVDDDEFNDLNKPCRVDGERVSPAGTCGGPPGDTDGSDSGVVLEWAENVSAGQRLVIQERNAGQAYDVVQPGESVTVIYRGDDFTAVLAETTVGTGHNRTAVTP
ncbi:type IV pilin [Haloarchaeobius iranensis]|uniref:Archaeal Type IV pilin N-terminal domain-containing protein n=1 Tax=Haloarchaeobius iranensis TaxID=996166 RepID=A0A1G9Y7N2_9EURY|nr:type IV pilin [Haloarchaeobius iranensis]SDN04531.1 Protein of unknown function [Haloarchaeobius iranensis]